VEEYLWSHSVGSAASNALKLQFLRLKLSGKPKVADFEDIVLHHHILKLQIPVNDIFRM
jgi:hypothetical protein